MAAFSDARDAVLFRTSCPDILGAAVAGDVELSLYVSTDGVRSGPEVRQKFRRCYGVNPKRVVFTGGLRWPAVGWCPSDPEPVHGRPALATYVFEAPSDDLETALADIWSAILGVQQAGVLDDFWESGGDSLGIVELIEHLSETYGVGLDFADVNADLTIRKLATLIRPIRSKAGRT
ncbi:phosphopantetheine-binding protein [Kitasatospora sp. NBC_01287]|uniref:phosphopantetheine-binding protein n=1 Tax=Kitasatospora sp. NBC_01287 TaxID=2903573 RepID=UPI002255C9A0|nr:phosphopantetheine-binding protein [Kitasatospora sp. NBC_01287]MCX4749345.1 phosphopantetheine-binding protein [Kitasatospora sp. NBC_01287]